MPKKSSAGSILTLIGGILTLIVSGFLLLISLVFMFIPKVELYLPEAFLSVNAPLALFLIFFILFIIVLLLGIFKLHASKLMKNPKTTLKGGIMALILGIISSFDILSIIGGILGIVQGSK